MKRIWILFTIIHALSLTIQGSPVQVTRIIIPKNNAPALTIDLIHDIHLASQDLPSTNAENQFEKYLKPTELKLFLPQERAFINTLYQLDQTSDHPITLLWECNPAENLALNNKLKNEINSEFDYLNCKKLLVYYGFYFFQHKPFTNNMHFIPSDTWRPNSLLNKIFNNNTKINYSCSAEEGFQFVLRHFEPNNDIEKQLAKVKNLHPEAYDKVNQLYTNFKDNTLKPLHTQFILPYLNKKNSLKTAISQIKKKDSFHNLIEKILSIPGLMDFESLCNIFSSKDQHIMLYAGIDHCNYLIDTLVKHFNGRVITDVGAYYDDNCLASMLHSLSNRRVLQIPLPQLKKEVWDFILESPNISWNRYIQSGSIQSVISGDILKSIDSLRKNDLMDSICETLVHYASRAYIDIANAQDESQQSLLHLAALYRSSALTELLLKEKAFADLPNLFGTTALLYATAQKDTTIMKLLLDAGANPLKKDATGLCPLVLAYHMNNESLITLLKHYENNDEQLD